MYVATLDHDSKKYTAYGMMISCSPIGSDPVSYLYLFEPVQTHASSSFPPQTGGHKRWSLAYYWYC